MFLHLIGYEFKLWFIVEQKWHETEMKRVSLFFLFRERERERGEYKLLMEFLFFKKKKTILKNQIKRK